MKNLLVILLVIISSNCFAQFGGEFHLGYGVIDDPDGYTNVRAKPSSKSLIAHVIYDGEIFEYGFDEESNWARVLVPENEFTLGIMKESFKFIGYIHKSRIKSLDAIKDYGGDAFSIEYDIQPFDSTGRVIGRHEDGWIQSLDGQHVWGADGNFPRNQVKGIKMTLNGKSIPVHEIFYRDLFECRNEFEVKEKNGYYFVFQTNSDGAGGYAVIWVVSRAGIKQRIVRVNAG